MFVLGDSNTTIIVVFFVVQKEENIESMKHSDNKSQAKKNQRHKGQNVMVTQIHMQYQ